MNDKTIKFLAVELTVETTFCYNIIGAKSSVNMENYARKENSRKIIFSIEF